MDDPAIDWKSRRANIAIRSRQRIVAGHTAAHIVKCGDAVGCRRGQSAAQGCDLGDRWPGSEGDGRRIVAHHVIEAVFHLHLDVPMAKPAVALPGWVPNTSLLATEQL